jgi:hypothetical protein
MNGYDFHDKVRNNSKIYPLIPQRSQHVIEDLLPCLFAGDIMNPPNGVALRERKLDSNLQGLNQAIY